MLLTASALCKDTSSARWELPTPPPPPTPALTLYQDLPKVSTILEALGKIILAFWKLEICSHLLKLGRKKLPDPLRLGWEWQP